MTWYTNKRIVLTGATSGIGRKLLDRLIEKQALVIAVGRNIEALPSCKQVIPYSCDISTAENVDKLFQFAVSKMGGIDIFFANAGFGYYEVLDKANWEHIDAIFRTNVYSPIYALEKMVELNRKQKFSFVITASEVARTPLAGFSLYTSTKFAIDGFAQTIRYELPVNAHLTVVYPVAMRTAFFPRSSQEATLPIFRQSVDATVRKVLRGVAHNKRFIHPMPLYNLSVWIIRVFPPLGTLALHINSLPFRKWLKNNRTTVAQN